MTCPTGPNCHRMPGCTDTECPGHPAQVTRVKASYQIEQDEFETDPPISLLVAGFVALIAIGFAAGVLIINLIKGMS